MGLGRRPRCHKTAEDGPCAYSGMNPDRGCPLVPSLCSVVLVHSLVLAVPMLLPVGNVLATWMADVRLETQEIPSTGHGPVRHTWQDRSGLPPMVLD